jgi:outer membrane lipoprotein carrier protein
MLARLINQILIQTAVFAAVAQASPVNERDLEKQLHFYKSIEELTTTFHQTKHLSEMKLDLQSDGRLTLNKPDRIIWEITKPSRLVVTISKTDVRIESKGETQTFKFQELSQDNVANGINMLVPWLMLDAHALSETYRVTEDADHGFVFEPKKANGSITKMILFLNDNGHLKRLKLFEASGDWIEIQFDAPKVVRKKV